MPDTLVPRPLSSAAAPAPVCVSAPFGQQPTPSPLLDPLQKQASPISESLKSGCVRSNPESTTATTTPAPVIITGITLESTSQGGSMAVGTGNTLQPMRANVGNISWRYVPCPVAGDVFARVKPGKAQWQVLIGICTHLGCIPNGPDQGDFDGWLCPCHGSQYDSAGRIRKGPAPKNLVIPPYKYNTDTKITIG